MTVGAAATHFKVHASTIRSWIRRGAPCLEAGSVGRGHGSRLDPQAVQNWLVAQRVPSVAVEAEQEVLTILATALFDSVKRDHLADQIGMTEAQAARAVLVIFERAFRNVRRQPLQRRDLPEEMKRLCAIYLDSIERRIF